ncbi:di-heme oxidoredictase family protein [Maritimibacter sp. DP1N21-5]|uniref:di-heme oxidoreductase family protein n=1 Tax=Maritimibacter sp. DP1N21-5 TaxID=2836867 RepID=UPI001C44B073|nr:di-heme oxidoredictase family protein [Maritimibacter sp. DP1N21-5]MBV7410953.1 thiol oxidoreductase [Maritimibacter sp. DP1N21-5]
MPSLTRARWTIASNLVALFLASSAFGFELTDDHLQATPRTAEEIARIAAVTTPTDDFSAPEAFEERPGGATTVRARANADAFSQPSANIGFDGELEFKVGNGLFRKIWVTAPSSTIASDGLGPLYNARGCQNCHFKDGRGHVPEGPDDNAVSMFLRVSIPADTALELQQIEDFIGTAEEPTYGGQIQDFATSGLDAEARMVIRYRNMRVKLDDGTVVTLRKPRYSLKDLRYGPLHKEAMLSPRVAPQMIGLGLLEAIPAEDILAHADEADEDGDGISGRPNLVWSIEHEKVMLGRFGLKAGTPTIRHQSAAAFSRDIGISNSLFPDPGGDCTEAQVDCHTAVHGDDAEHGGFEVDDAGLDLVTFYSQHVAVPARRGVEDPEVLRGKEMFYGARCTACHVPKFVTARMEDRESQSFQLIWPYTDMLLHDMGEGLADHRPEARATGTEWRTAPLWGIGLTELVSGHENYLHDGRARTLEEAILWHGGEAQAARDAYAAMPATDRAALIKFLESL